MSIDLLNRPSDLQENDDEQILKINPNSAQRIGVTAFELLAEDTRTNEQDSGNEDILPIRNSVTRHGDGQTVPDER